MRPGGPLGRWLGAGAAILWGASAQALDPGKAPTQYGHDAWQIEQGLPQNTVNAIAQTPNGYLWLGTAEGLVRFDGVRFVAFDRRNTPAIPNNVVSALRVDRAGGLWIGTDSGLVHWQGGSFRAVTGSGAPAGRRITAVLEDRQGRVWVGTADHGMVLVQDGRFTPLTTADGLSSNRVRDLAEAPDGSLWIATEGGGLTHLREGRAETVRTPDGLPSDRVRSLLVDRSGALWVGTYDAGLAVRRDGRFHPMVGLAGAEVSALHEDRDGNLWIGLPGGGLARATGGELARFTSRGGLTNDKVLSLAEDAEGSLWIGCLAGGLNRLRDSKFTPVGTQEGLPNDQVRAVAEDRRGALWIGTEGGGLSQLRAGQVALTLTTRDGLTSDRVYAVSEDAEGALWIGGVGRGVNRWKDRQLSAYVPADPGVMNNVHTIVSDGRGTLWIGTLRDGLYRLQVPPGQTGRRLEGHLTPFTMAEGLSDNNVLALLPDGKGGLWVGTRGGGLNHVEDGRITALTTRQGFPNDFVYALHQDSDGVLWVGTFGGGLVRLEGDRRFVFTTAHGLFDDVIYGMVEDRAGDLWLTCNRGIFRVRRGELNEVAAGRRAAVTSIAYGLPDGMRSVECNSGGAPTARGRDGRLWFATVRGVVAVDPARLPINSVPPPVHIEEVLLDGRLQGLSPQVALPPGGRQFELRYTALSLRAPSRVRFRYRLEGLDREWTEAGTRRVAYYNRIPPGSYTFRVLAANDDGVWNEEGARLTLSVAPRFYETAWFYALLAGAVGLLVVGGHRFRVRHLRVRQAELMELVQARTAELRASEARALDAREEALRASQAKSAFLARMSHELRTPLNAILGFVQLMRQEAGRSAPDRERLDIVARSGEHLLRLINDVLSLAKIESGRLNLDESTFDPSALLREVHALFRPSAERKGLTLVLERELNDGAFPPHVRGDQSKLRQVLLNLLGNAVKFTSAGQVTLRGRWEDAWAVLEVQDTGPGIPPSERPLVFEAFAQAEAGRHSGEGTGLGLAISISFLRLMGGMLELIDPPGGGALFRIELPLPAAEASADADAPAPVQPMVLAPDQPRYRILAVDDAPENRLVLSGLLAAMGLEVQEAADGRSALEQWAAWRPDLVFMDMRMPELDGHQATRELRRREVREGWRRTPVVALTASVLDLDREALLAGGCDDVVLKPFRPSALWQALSRHLGARFVERPSAEPPPSAPPVGPVSLAHLPAAWRQELHRAVERGDVQMALGVVERIAPQEAATAESLRALLKAYRLEAVLELTAPPPGA
jgi:signal transduction histidine kinase/ligand-binding sensor domain-containing protein/CheY-like chemotaxis protein